MPSSSFSIGFALWSSQPWAWSKPNHWWSLVLNQLAVNEILWLVLRKKSRNFRRCDSIYLKLTCSGRSLWRSPYFCNNSRKRKGCMVQTSNLPSHQFVLLRKLIKHRRCFSRHVSCIRNSNNLPCLCQSVNCYTWVSILLLVLFCMLDY